MNGQDAVHIVDDNPEVRRSLGVLMRSHGYRHREFPDAASFLEVCTPETTGCAIVDVRLPGLSGLDLQREIKERGYALPVIVVSGHADVPMAVRAMKAGAVDFFEKPFSAGALIASVERAMAVDARNREARGKTEVRRARLALLTPREREVLLLVSDGHYNKVIARKLGVSVSTVETHRRHIMHKLHAETLFDLVCAVEDDGARRP